MGLFFHATESEWIVCLLFSLIWGVACVLIVKILHPLIHKALDFLPEFVGWTCIVLFGVTLFVDLYVTVTDILKMNRKLAKMNEIATELHRISDEIGENIYEDVTEALELKEEMADRLKERAAEFHERRKDLSEDMREQIIGTAQTLSGVDFEKSGAYEANHPGIPEAGV